MKTLLIALLFTLISTLSSQTFDFCTDVVRGKPVGSGTEWSCSSRYDNCFIYGLLKLPYETNDEYVVYDLYRVTNGKEEYYNSFTYYTEGVDWSWVYIKMIFDRSGTYNVYIYTLKYYGAKYKYIGNSQCHWNFK